MIDVTASDRTASLINFGNSAKIHFKDSTSKHIFLALIFYLDWPARMLTVRTDDVIATELAEYK